MRFRGYDLDLLPFFGVTSLESMWKQAISVLNPEIAEKYKDGFLESVELRRNRLKLLGRKYAFYKRVLRRDAKIMERYGEAIGEEMLDDRVLYAVSGCFSNGERLKEKLTGLVRSFSDYCREQESEDYFPSMDAPASNCERTGVCGCIGSKRPYMSSCVGDLTSLLESKSEYDERMENFGSQMMESLKDNADLLSDYVRKG